MNLRDVRTIFYGTSEFGLPALEWLQANTNLVAIITTPDKPVGRKQEMLGSPVKQWLAGKEDIILLQPHTLKSDYLKQAMRHLSAEVAVLASYGKIVPKDVLEIPARGTLNLHPSLLPKFRGATPIQSVLMAGENTTGTTLMLMDELLDHGPILAQAEMPIEAADTYQILHDRLAWASRDILAANLEKYLNAELPARKQDHDAASLTSMLAKEDGLIDWSKPATHIERQVRAYNPWPGTYAKLKSGDILKIFRVIPADVDLPPAGVKIDGQRLFVGTGSGALEILELQAAGGKRLQTPQFLAGLREELHFGF